MQQVCARPLTSVRAPRAAATAGRRVSRLRVTSELTEGTKVKVANSVVIYHAMGRKEGLDIQGKEGTVVKDVRQYNGEELSANLPYKVEVIIGDPSEKKGKVLVHLAEEELEVV